MDASSESSEDSSSERDWRDDGNKSRGPIEDLDGIFDGDSSDVANFRLLLSGADIAICLTLCFL